MSRRTPMNDDAQREADEQIERRLGVVLRWGVITSTTCLSLGLASSLFLDVPLVAGTLLTVGLLLLLGTPVARVAASVVQYAVQRDWLFATLTGLVLLELFAGVVAALAFHRRL